MWKVSQRITESPECWEIKCMRKQWIPGSLSPPPREPGYVAKSLHAVSPPLPPIREVYTLYYYTRGTLSVVLAQSIVSFSDPMHALHLYLYLLILCGKDR